MNIRVLLGVVAFSVLFLAAATAPAAATVDERPCYPPAQQFGARAGQLGAIGTAAIVGPCYQPRPAFPHRVPPDLLYWGDGRIILKGPTDPMLIYNPNSSTGYPYQMVVNDRGPGDIYQSSDGVTWVLTHDDYYVRPVGDCRIVNGTYYCLNGRGWVYEGPEIDELRNTTVRTPIREGTWLYENGTWYAFDGSSERWRRECCVSPALELYTAENPAGPWVSRGVVVNRTGKSWGTGDPYIVKAGGRYYLFADMSSNHPYYRVALWVSDTLSGRALDWTLKGRRTWAPGGDPQVVFDPERGRWMMVNEFGNPPYRWIRLRFNSTV